MPPISRVFSPGPTERTVRSASGEIVTVPTSWELLPPGDAGLTRRVKAAGETWAVQEKKGRKTFSQGIWADANVIASEREKLAAERSTPAFAKRRAADSARRDRQQSEYVEDFCAAVLQFLAFSPQYQNLAQQLAAAVTTHATPVGSGTVARTKRIPVEQRAESAVIAWLRHQTTAYDTMRIARVKGERREVRRQLAERSRALLDGYRRGLPINPAQCPLATALKTGATN